MAGGMSLEQPGEEESVQVHCNLLRCGSDVNIAAISCVFVFFLFADKYIIACLEYFFAFAYQYSH